MKKRLGDYIQEYSVRNKSGEDIPVYSITNSQGFCRDYFSKEVASKDKTTISRKLFHEVPECGLSRLRIKVISLVKYDIFSSTRKGNGRCKVFNFIA